MILRTDVSLTTEAISVEDALKAVNDINCGAVATFLGVTRADTVNNKLVTALEFEAHEPLALSVLRTIIDEYRKSDPELVHVFIQHRIGRVPVGETNVVVAVSAGHRKCAFRAVESLMNLLKAKLPVWKKEIFDDRSSRWLENTEFNTE